ncbi:ABC transporter permease [Latilactobacillus fuchuensis]|uniref:MacB-like periplasmic core domain-containing protein n=2 Tax=Latilactobacillus fuchuensis TaxID=164393 RepID=A0A2N9DVC0_9LACO|nr:ABC transporter permease [Latilactobacillus fuchuensis]KRL62109.1 hypothetical protein FC69_GL000981 [Latilactobacillus fuchuensis DSM 14340 = JCM 11249]SPC38413.1 conserved membrane hypothetical protein [Latilactobacillus fuchuensis]
MRYKKIALDILLVVVTLLGLLVISQRAKANYSQRLNHNSLSQKAVIFKPKTNQTIQTTLQAIEKAKLTNFQIQFNVNQRFSYIYAQGKVSSVPIKDGRFFSSYDFKSSVPVVVVGQSRAADLYQPTSQAYYQYHKQYLSVIGVVGTNQATSLDQHVFVSASPKYVINDRPLSAVTVLVDDQEIGTHLKTYQKIFKTTKISYLTPKSTPLLGLNWLKSNSPVILGLLGLVLVLLIITHLFAKIVNGYQTQKGLDQALYRRYRSGQTQLFAAHLLVSTLVGFSIGAWFFYLTQQTVIFGGLMVIDLIAIGYFYSRMRRLTSQ